MPAASPDIENPWTLPSAQLTWSEDGAPRSVEFGDVYFSREGGLDETDYVFLQQNRLRERWQALDTQNPGVFVIAETGFGTGLNFLAAWQLWNSMAPRGWRLCFISAEQYPLTHDQLTRALAAWPQLVVLSEQLLMAYPPRIRGFHRRELSADVTLQLLFDDAGQGFDALLDSAADLPNGFAVDAWFLDGFAPAKNPGMWTPQLFRSIARLSKPDTTFATFTCAGHVKRGLREVGFDVRKVPGHGSKREMLRGVFSNRAVEQIAEPIVARTFPQNRVPAIEYWAQPPFACKKQRVIVIGGGLAGTSTAHALARRGWPVTLLERGDTLAGGASGNPQGVLYTKLSPQDSALSAFALLSYLHALDHYRQLQRAGVLDANAAQWCGVLQLETDARLREVFADQTDWVQALDAETASAIAGCVIPLSNQKKAALLFSRAGWLRPALVCAALARHPLIETRLNCNVRSMTRADDGWSLQLDAEVLHAPIVVIASANDSNHIHPDAHWPVRPMRGQITSVPADWIAQMPRTVICHEGYLAPEHDGSLCIGATFDKDDDSALRPQDHRRNLQSLMSALPAVLKDNTLARADELEGRVGFRCTTPDYLPIVGAVADTPAMRERFAMLARNARSRVDTPGAWLPGLYVNIGHGSRGLTSTPLCAEHLAALITGEPRPLPRTLAQALSPARFILRDLIRGL